jgi:hypothetical protein
MIEAGAKSATGRSTNGSGGLRKSRVPASTGSRANSRVLLGKNARSFRSYEVGGPTGVLSMPMFCFGRSEQRMNRIARSPAIRPADYQAVLCAFPIDRVLAARLNSSSSSPAC